MKKILYVLNFTLSLFFIGSCEIYLNTEDQVEDYTEHICFKIVDNSNSLPVKGAFVRAHFARYHDSKLIFYFSLTNTSDASGNCCFEYRRPGEVNDVLDDLFAKKAGYVYRCVPGSPPSIVRLTPAAYIQFHIKNVPPMASNDQIGIKHLGTTCSGFEILILEGAKVDTSLVVETQPVIHDISWRSWHNQVSSDTTISGITSTERDTVRVEILY